MNHEAKEQAAKDFAAKSSEIAYQIVADLPTPWAEKIASLCRKNFDAGYDAGHAAGASWREQQAASGFEGWRSAYTSRIDGYNNMIGTGTLSKDAWEASALHSAKLLAEKDAEIEKAKELIKEMRDALNFYSSNVTSVWDCNGEHLLEDESETARKTLRENAEKIKALLGEE